jgi:hypothetical protein
MMMMMMTMMMMRRRRKRRSRRRRRRTTDRIRICEGTLALIRVQPCLHFAYQIDHAIACWFKRQILLMKY